MSGDFSRQRFAPSKDYSAVFSQQGRVQLDADWNELVEIFDRRHRAETVDTMGPATVPRQTPDGFKIALTGGVPTIGPGRIYVHGLLAENHGKLPTGQTLLDFDPILAELVGSAPLPYTEQPYLPNVSTVAPFPTTGGPHLVYLDVWQRDVTALQDPDLVENAVGVDTTTRSQTAWQVRVLENVGSGVTCASPDSALQGWLDLTAPSAGRLTTDEVGVAEEEDPCLTPASGGYKGLENYLYRVEIHTGGTQGNATFKWSRDNASVATNVTSIPAVNTLVVARVKWDALLRFSIGDWIEITDDWRELAGQPGIMALILNVDDATRTITLDRNLPTGAFPTAPVTDETDPDRHTRIRRWDQKNEITDSKGVRLVDLAEAGSPGVIPLPAATASVILEDGVQVTFSTVAAGGEFQTGDYWTFAARTADASVEELDQAPPRGVHHHYCRLALVTFPTEVLDCRTLWPPEVAGPGCDCTACVNPETHNSGVYSIQRAIDDVKAIGGKVCLAPGEYVLREPVRIEGARSVRLQGKGWLTNLVFLGKGPAMFIDKSTGITLEEFRLMTSELVSYPASVLIHNSSATTLQRCVLAQVQLGRDTGEGDALPGAVIGLTGITLATVIRENLILGSYGVASLPDQQDEPGPLTDRGQLVAAELAIEDNLMRCRARGVSLDGTTLFIAETRIAGNVFDVCEEGGIFTTGLVVSQEQERRGWAGPSHIEIRGNTLGTIGDAIVVGTDDTRVLDNDIGLDGVRTGSNGIVLAAGAREDIQRCQILGNRIRKLAGHGITIRTRVRSAMIKQNVIGQVGGMGIHMEDGSAEFLSIENNHLTDIARVPNGRDAIAVGIFLANAGEVAIVGNTIAGVGLESVENQGRAGIALIGATTGRIIGNEVVEIGPESFLGFGYGIVIVAFSESMDVLDNIVHRGRSALTDPEGASGSWLALWIENRGLSPEGDRTLDRRLGSLLDIRFIPRREAFGTAVLFSGRAFLIVGQPSVAARGNVFDTYGELLTATIGITGSCIFGENRCASRGRFMENSPWIVGIEANAVVASGNVISGNAEPDSNFELVGLNIDTGAEDRIGLATVLGNIVTPTTIRLNNNPLGDPWAPLNL